MGKNGSKKQGTQPQKKNQKKGFLPFACGRKNVRKDDFGPQPDDDDLSSRLNKRAYYLFFKKKSGKTVEEEEEKKITRATTARSSVFCVTPQSASTRGVYTFWILDRVL